MTKGPAPEITVPLGSFIVHLFCPPVHGPIISSGMGKQVCGGPRNLQSQLFVTEDGNETIWRMIHKSSVID